MRQVAYSHLAHTGCKKCDDCKPCLLSRWQCLIRPAAQHLIRPQAQASCSCSALRRSYRAAACAATQVTPQRTLFVSA